MSCLTIPKTFYFIAICSSVLFAQLTLDLNVEKQTIDGFGACDAWYADEIMSYKKSQELLDCIFDSTKGIGLSILRQKVSEDFTKSDGSLVLNDENFGGSAWMIKQAAKRGVKIFWGSSWSPPGWMKSNNSHKNGGTLLPQNYSAFAIHLSNWIKHLKDSTGVSYYAISPQNEPGQKSWASCVWTPQTYNEFLRDYLKPEFAKQKIVSRVVIPEETRWANVKNYADLIMADSKTAPFIGIIGGHCYPKGSNVAADYSNYNRLIWETEWSYDVDIEDTSMQNGLEWAQNYHQMLTATGVSAVHHWWLVSFKYDGLQQGLTNVDSLGNYSLPKRFWTMGNFSKFVRPGFKRIDIKSSPSENLFLSVYKQPKDNRLAIVLINKNTASKELTISFKDFVCSQMVAYRTSKTENLKQVGTIASDNQKLTITIPASSVMTLSGVAQLSPTSIKLNNIRPSISKKIHLGTEKISNEKYTYFSFRGEQLSPMKLKPKKFASYIIKQK